MMKKAGMLIFAILIVLGVGGAGAAFMFLNSKPSSSSEQTTFYVEPGQSFRTIAQRLAEAQLITNPEVFIWYARLSRQSARVRVGEYAIAHNLRPVQVLQILTTGKSIEYTITVQEGLNRFEVADVVGRQKLISSAEFLRLSEDPQFIRELLDQDLPSLEGYLFPETYKITRFTGAKGLIRQMVQNFKVAYADAVSQGQEKMSRHEAVTLASIIEKETGAPMERPRISSVFHNRLKQNMRLQTDPTVIYGIWSQTKKMPTNITRQDLTTSNRYNTYTFTGLPYGPISNPGLHALRAALRPESSAFLFFVSRNDGTHVF